MEKLKFWEWVVCPAVRDVEDLDVAPQQHFLTTSQLSPETELSTASCFDQEHYTHGNVCLFVNKQRGRDWLSLCRRPKHPNISRELFY